MPKSDQVKDEGTVQPLESVDESPKSDNKTKELCWNCTSQGEKNYLDKNGVCEVCGFDKNLLYNGDLEADKRAQRVEAARAAEQAGKG